MKVLQISNYYYPHIGGIEQVAHDIAGALGGVVGLEQKVFCFNSEKADCTDVVDGVEVVRAGAFAKIASQSLSFSYGKLLKKTFKTFNPDTVIFHFPNPFGAHYLLKILKRFPKCKLIVYWHLDIIKQKFLGKFFNGQTRRLLKRACKIVATSPNYIDGSVFLSANRQKCTVIPNCVNSERASLSQQDALLSQKIRAENVGKTICLAVGRHVPYKGMEYLVRASKHLDENYVVYICGEGPLTDSLKSMANGDAKVKFLGRLGDGDLKAYISACDIFCFPSVTKNEAFGIALAEAMSFGKPSITFTIAGSGVNYVSLADVTGLEVENGNYEKFAEAIKILADDKQLREKFGLAAKQRVEEFFTMEKFANNILKLILEVD